MVLALPQTTSKIVSNLTMEKKRKDSSKFSEYICNDRFTFRSSICRLYFGQKNHNQWIKNGAELVSMPCLKVMF